jgi:hypothetical protein
VLLSAVCCSWILKLRIHRFFDTSALLATHAYRSTLP